MASADLTLAEPALAALRSRIDERLKQATSAEDPTMDEMASHLVLAGGKRLRPIMTALASQARVGGNSDDTAAVVGRVGDDAITGGVAVELVHAGSLHHDDVIDEADTRHGVTSVNARWGNLRAILSGDFLLARASELAASLGTEVAGLLAATIGRLCEGEVRELRFAYDVDRSQADYDAAIEGKTAALYATAARIGGLVSALPREQVEVLTRFGMRYGTAFQVVDDVLDLTATEEQLGKPSGHDMAEGIYTLPVLLTLAPEARDQKAAAELRGLLGGPLSDDARQRARELVTAGPAVAASVAVAEDLVARAVEELAGLTPGHAVDLLAAMAHALTASLPSDAG